MQTEATPQFEVVFKGESLEPIADVAPEGEVTFVLVNASEQPHDFALARLDGEEDGRRARARPSTEADTGIVALVPSILPGDSRMFTRDMVAGRYVLISNTPGATLGVSLFELHIQEADGE